MLFLGIRMLMQRQAQKLNDGIKVAVTPENARKAALALSDEQHRELYRAIGAEDGRRALAIFKQSTGAPIKDCIIAVQALHAYPQQAPSELRAEDELGGSDDDGADRQPDRHRRSPWISGRGARRRAGRRRHRRGPRRRRLLGP